MGNFYTSDELIESIKNRALIPKNQSTFSDDDFLRLANEEMLMGIMPMVLQYHEDYFVNVEETPIVANQSNYTIPYRAAGNRLKDVMYKDPQGNLYRMSRVPSENIMDFQSSFVGNNVDYFFVQNNEIIILPSIGSQVSGSLVFRYYIRPNELVLSKNGGLITGINTNSGEVTVSKLPTTYTNTELYDFTMFKSPHKTLKFDITAASVNTVTKTVTFNPSDLPEGLVIGDYLMLAEQTVIPQIPSDLHVILAQRVACRCLEALGDTQGLQNANLKLQEMEFKAASLIDDRVEGSAQKLVSSGSLMRRYLQNKIIRRRI